MIHSIVDTTSPVVLQQQQQQQNQQLPEQQRQAYLQELTADAALGHSQAAPKSPKQKRTYTRSPGPAAHHGNLSEDSSPKEKAEKPMSQAQEHALAMEIHRQICEYMDSKYFREILKDFPRPEPPPKNTYETLLSLKNTMKACLFKQHRTALVDNMFSLGIQATEFSLVELAKQVHFKNMTSIAMQNRDQLFQPELEELAIEMSNSWIPSPTTRLVFKVASMLMNIHASYKMQEQFQNANPKMYQPQAQQQAEPQAYGGGTEQTYDPTQTTLYDERPGEDGTSTNSKVVSFAEATSSPSFSPSPSQSSSSQANYYADPGSESISSTTYLASQTGNGQQNNIFSNLREATSSFTAQSGRGRRNFSNPSASARKASPSSSQYQGSGENSIDFPTDLGNFDHAKS